MAATGTAPYDWAQRVLAATSEADLNALWLEAINGDFGTASRFALISENQAALRRVNQTMMTVADRALAPISRVNQQGAATLFRSTVPGLIDEFGNVNALIAKNYYQAQRFVYFKQQVMSNGITAKRAQNNLRRQATNRAQAQLQSQLAVANGYKAKLPGFDPLAKADSVVNYGMSLFMKNGPQAKQEIMNAITRAVASYNRDTILFNSALDSDVVGVQRVAEPGACDFCAMVAFDRYGSARVSSYAANYHNNCHCTIETLYENDKPIVPDYYADFEYAPSDLSIDLTSESWANFKKNYPPDFISA